MRATEGFHIEWVGEEAVVLDPRTGQVHYLNPPAAYVYALILEHGYDAAIAQVHDAYPDGSPLRTALPDLVADMREKGLLEGEAGDGGATP